MLGLLFPSAYNFGTNILLGQISYITEALATVLDVYKRQPLSSCPLSLPASPARGGCGGWGTGALPGGVPAAVSYTHLAAYTALFGSPNRPTM